MACTRKDLREVEYGVGHGGIVGLERLEDEQESCDALVTRLRGGSIYGTPFSYVATKVAQLATFCSDENSSRRLSSRVRTRDCKRSAQNLSHDDERPFMKAHSAPLTVEVSVRCT